MNLDKELVEDKIYEVRDQNSNDLIDFRVKKYVQIKKNYYSRNADEPGE